MYDNPFVLPIKEYKRDINVLQHYVTDQATYLEIMTGRPRAECEDHVRKSLKPGGIHEFKDPIVYYLERGDNGDRRKAQTTLSQYLGTSMQDRELIAPTLTTYLNPRVKQALLVDFIDTNVAARSKAKKAMFAAKVSGDKATEAFKKGEQTNRKLSNNSISGAHVSASTPLYNKTAHSTLTSNCRSTSGYGNANNEKFLCGNRHYWSPEIARNNIISIINHSDYEKILIAMQDWGIRAPTVEETMECITYSTRLYWTSPTELARLRLLVEKLTEIQRCAFVYTGDLYHLMRFNPEVVREFLTRLSKYCTEPNADPQDIFNTRPEEHRHLAMSICQTEMKGKGRTVTRLPSTGQWHVPSENDSKVSHERSAELLAPVAATTVNIGDTVEAYRTLIRAFWTSPNVPASVAHFPDSVRRAAVTSDTDSTIFTVQDWVHWYRGKHSFDQQAQGLAATMIFLAAQTITHVLARMSANFGIEEKRLFQIAMKNEFYFPVFTPTQVAKHYFALIGAQEGDLRPTLEEEIKGVHLKSSNAPKVVVQEAKRMMLFIMNSVIEEKTISASYLLKWVGDLERSVIDSIKKGSYEYFRMGQVKTPESYAKDPTTSPYAQYVMWQAVFAPKYGESQPPPYMSVKVSLELDSPAKTAAWIESMEDKELAQRMRDWLASSGKKHMGTSMMLPEQCVASKGLPQEVLDAIGVRKIVLDTTKIFYLILETLGISMLNDKTTRLISDYH